MLADIDGDLAAKEAERIVREGGTAIGVACDVADEAQVAAMVDRAVAEYGRLDIMRSTMPASRCRRRTPPTSRSSISSASPRLTSGGSGPGMKHELRVMRDQAAARSSTVHPWAVSSASRSAQPITAPSTPCSE